MAAVFTYPGIGMNVAACGVPRRWFRVGTLLAETSGSSYRVPAVCWGEIPRKEDRSGDAHLVEAILDVTDSFASRYEQWTLGRNRYQLKKGLSDGYRTAWASGDGGDRGAVLDFIFDRRDPEGFDLLIEGLRSDDARLASNAAVIVSALINEGFDMGPTIRNDLAGFGARFPEWTGVYRSALRFLDRFEERKR